MSLACWDSLKFKPTKSIRSWVIFFYVHPLGYPITSVLHFISLNARPRTSAREPRHAISCKVSSHIHGTRGPSEKKSKRLDEGIKRNPYTLKSGQRLRGWIATVFNLRFTCTRPWHGGLADTLPSNMHDHRSFHDRVNFKSRDLHGYKYDVNIWGLLTGICNLDERHIVLRGQGGDNENG